MEEEDLAGVTKISMEIDVEEEPSQQHALGFEDEDAHFSPCLQETSYGDDVEHSVTSVYKFLQPSVTSTSASACSIPTMQAESNSSVVLATQGEHISFDMSRKSDRASTSFSFQVNSSFEPNAEFCAVAYEQQADHITSDISPNSGAPTSFLCQLNSSSEPVIDFCANSIIVKKETDLFEMSRNDSYIRASRSLFETDDVPSTVSFSQQPAFYEDSHFRDKTPEEDHVCDICHAAFTTYGFLQQHKLSHVVTFKPHKRVHSKKKKNHVCVSCNKRFKSLLQLEEHKVNHEADQDLHVCTNCDMAFTSESEFQQHVLTHSEGMFHICELCLVVFLSASDLEDHMLSHDTSFSDPSAVSLISDSDTATEEHVCDVCDAVFTTHDFLQKHLVSHKGGMSMLSKLHCNICNKAFATNAAFKRHALTHPDKRLYVCELCSIVFMSAAQLENHIKMQNHNLIPAASTTDDEHICDFCDTAFTSYDFLQQHKLCHKVAKNHVCDVCNKAFTRALKLRLHKRVHGEQKKKRACNVCEESFTSLKKLKEHKSSHQQSPSLEQLKEHELTQQQSDTTTASNQAFVAESACSEQGSPTQSKQKFHVCDVCLKVFPSADDLEQHVLTHKKPSYGKRLLKSGRLKINKLCPEQNKFKCDICNKRFEDAENFQTHVSSHLEEMNLMCNLCDKHFSGVDYLMEHKREHCKNGHYICTMCDEISLNEEELKEHKLLFHSKKKRGVACDVCNKEFTLVRALKSHKLYMHGDASSGSNASDLNKSMACDVCNKVFTISRALRSHKLYMHGEVSSTSDASDGSLQVQNFSFHICTACYETFPNADDLKEHKSLFHPKKKKNLVCDMCSKVFSQRRALKAHRLYLHGEASS